jgi:hypothetical protein
MDAAAIWDVEDEQLLAAARRGSSAIAGAGRAMPHLVQHASMETER